MKVNNKNIGLITWFKSENYGTNLQAYALYHKICSLGYNCYFVNEFDYNNISLKDKLIAFLNKMHLLSFIKGNFVKSVNKSRFRKSIAFFDQFTRVVYVSSIKEYLQLLNNFDAFVSGSDQIWNPNYFNPFYFLDFAGNNKRIAYASSIGVTTFTQKQSGQIKPLVEKYDYCGIREDSGVKLLNSIIKSNFARQVVDPTFLISAREWLELTKKSSISIKGGYVLCYLIGNRHEYFQQIECIAKKYNACRIVVIPSIENPNLRVPYGKWDVDYYPQAGIEDFVKLINGASIVCTDSFHATAISINLKKNFVEFMRFTLDDPKSQNSRITDILKRYNLQNRIYGSNTDFCNIDYAQVMPILQQDIDSSVEFLKNALEN